MPTPSHILSGPNQLPTSCDFFSLPPELRDIIYRDLILSGNLEILRVCHQVHDEVKHFVYTLRVCRVDFACTRGSPHSDEYLKVYFPPRTLPDGVQTFILNIGLYGYSHDIRIVDPYLRNFVKGSGDCHITLVAEHYDCFVMQRPVKHLIRSLSSFRLITVRIRVVYTLHPLDRRNESKVEPGHIRNLHLLATKFSKALGHPEWKTDSYPRTTLSMLKQPHWNPYPTARYLEFRPRK